METKPAPATHGHRRGRASPLWASSHSRTGTGKTERASLGGGSRLVPTPAWRHQGHTCILFQLGEASPQETWEKNLRFLSLQVKSQVSCQHENSYVSGGGLAGELGLTTQLPWVFRLSDGEGLCRSEARGPNSSSLFYHPPNTRCQGPWLWKRMQEGLNPVSKGDCGGGTLDTPTAGSAPGLLVLFSLKSGFSQNRIAYILELKIYGGSNVPECMVGGGPHAHTHGVCVHVPRTHTRVCAHTVYINIYIAQVYMLFTVYIYINIKHRYLYVCTIDTP